MKFKTDENIPIEIAKLLKSTGYDTMTIMEQGLSGEQDYKIAKVCQQEERILITLDLDFSDIRTYPPTQYCGIIVLRVYRQDKLNIITTFKQVIPLLEKEQIANRLWIILISH
ncbi:MAG: DUF5615 family PIN-like protein [Desulfobacterales bacterium]|nr:DUF5615 family PIN-like protein [Desulfobacterales bacterium]